MNWQSAEPGTEGRQLLEERLAELETEIPEIMFNTKEKLQRTVITKKRNRINVRYGTYVGFLFALIGASTPDYINGIEYNGLKISLPLDQIQCEPNPKREQWHGDGTLQQRDILPGHTMARDTDVVYGFFIDETNYRLQIHREDGKVNREVQERIEAIFEKLKEFERSTKPKSRFLKPLYDIVIAYRR